jgi:hypothetical protein
MEKVTINWLGPYAWAGFEKESALPALPNHGGVYIKAYQCGDFYHIHYPGITGGLPGEYGAKRTLRGRFSQHRYSYLRGNSLLDPVQAAQGIRFIIPHPAAQADFGERQAYYQAVARQQMIACRIFTTELLSRRIMERLEAAIMFQLHKDRAPLAFPDGGKMNWLALGRRENEAPILVKNTGAVDQLYELPAEMII